MPVERSFRRQHLMRLREPPEPTAEPLATIPLSRVQGRGAGLPSAPLCFYPSGLCSKLRGVFLDSAGGFALRLRGKPRRFVSPAFRSGAGRRAAGGPAASPAGPGAAPTPGPAAGRSGKGLCSRGATPPQPPLRSLLPANPRVAGAPERPQEKGEKSLKKALVVLLPLSRQVLGKGSGPYGGGEG
ncbi:uncharacterized protein GJ701_004035 [Geothlypis trichas]